MARARWLLLGAALLATSTARAQSGSDVTTAQALFEEGKRLMQDKHFAEACPKLVESQQLDPGGGTLLAIALCHEGEGRLATAWGDFNLAASEARKDHRTDRETAALGHVRALEPRLTRARIVVAMGVPGLQISRDEKPVGSAELGTPLPIDAGDHTFEARAPGKETWHKTITIAGEGKTVDVTVPILEDEPKPPSVAPAPVPTAPSAPPPPAPTALPSTIAPAPTTSATPAPAPPPPSDSGSSMRTAGFVTGGISLAVAAVGFGFGASALSTWHQADTGCNGTVCSNPNAPSQSASAEHAADASSVLVGVGCAGVAVSALLIILAPSSPAKTHSALRVAPMIGLANGLVIGGDL
ncbi:MAG: hypothetical protein ACLQVI_25095 [Polyangiaceae bacterium]|jgi:hypothetical protein